MDTKFFRIAMEEQGYSDFSALPPHEQSNIMRRAQELKTNSLNVVTEDEMERARR
jgi:hypothetical protein